MSKKPTYEELEKRVKELEEEALKRKQAEKALRSSELWLQNIFNSLEEAVFVVTPDRRLVNVNDAAERMFGYSREELSNLSTEVLHVDHEHYLEFGRRIKEAFDQGKTADFEFETKRENGEVFPTEHTVSLLKNEEGESLGIVSVVRDIVGRKLAQEALQKAHGELEQRVEERTSELVKANEHLKREIEERKRAQEALRKSEHYFRSLLMHMHESILVIDRDYRITDINNSLLTTIGRTREEVMGHHCYEVLHGYNEPCHRRGEECKLREVFETGKPCNCLHEHLRADGSSVWVDIIFSPMQDEQGCVTHVSEAARDITDLVQVNKALVERTHDLDERVKELNCLHGISSLLGQPNISLEKILQGTADLIPPAWQYPEIICARIILDGQEFRTENFKETIWKQASDITVDGDRVGTLEVCYLEEKPQIEEGPFRKEERNLIDAISERLGKAVERKRVEESLRVSEERYRTLFEDSRDPVVISTREGKLVDVNQAWLDLYGYTREEITDLNLQKLYLNPDDRSRFQQKIEQKGSVKDFEVRHLKKDGTEIECQLTTTVRRADDGSILGYQGIIRDITEQKRIKEAIKEERNLLRTVIDNLPDYIYVKDAEGRYIVSNNAHARFLGAKTPEQVVGKTVFELFPQELASKYHADDQEVIQSDQPLFNREERSIDQGEGQADKAIWNLTTKVPLQDSHGKIVGLVGIARDISERKRAQEALRESHSLLHAIIEETPDCIFLKDHEGRYQVVNTATAHALGKPSVEEVVGRDDRELLPPAQARQLQQADRRIMDSGRSEEYEELVGDRTFMSMKTPYSDRHGNIVGIIGVARDFTELKWAKQEKEKLETQLRQAHKTEAIGTLAGGIAHDFNNILAAIIGYTELAREDVPEGSRIQSNLKEVLKAGIRAKDLIGHILTFSRQDEGQRRPLQIGLIVKEALKLLRASLPTTIDIRQDIKSQSGLISGDPTGIHQVLMNLSTNAGHAMREKGGVLEVRLVDEDLDAGAASVHPDLKPGPYLTLTVSDTGCGMDPEVMERIFDPYFTTKEVGEGTGMGLAVVHGIVESHGGAVAVDSTPGKGATFQVFFPRIKTEEVEEAGIVEPLPTGRERVLFVDDEKALVDIGKQILERLGYEVVARTSSIEALEAFKAQPHRFDLVITDQTMPNMTGEDLAKELMRIRPDIPVILCTGYSHMISEDKAKAMGIRAFIMKPILRHDIAQTIRRVLDQKDEKAT